MDDAKTKPTTASVDAFLGQINDVDRRADAQALLHLMHTATGETPVMWGPSIVGFGAYRTIYDSGRKVEAPLVAFSPRKRELVVYVMPGFAEYEPLLAKLGRHKTGKACLYIGRLAGVDMSVLGEIVQRSAKSMRQKYGAN